MTVKNGLLILITLLAFLISCKQAVKEHENPTSTSVISEIKDSIKSDRKKIKFDFNFEATIGQEENFENFKTYTFFQLTRNNTIIYTDSSLREYEFGNKSFPIIIKTDGNSFELLFEINNRPSKNYLKRLFIKDDRLVGEDKLPTFESQASDINKDGIKEYAGFWDHSERWGENDALTAYNPILYYSVTTAGLKLDSALTRQHNEVIYGKFYGFAFSEKDEQPTSVREKFEQELTMIKSGH